MEEYMNNLGYVEDRKLNSPSCPLSLHSFNSSLNHSLNKRNSDNIYVNNNKNNYNNNYNNKNKNNNNNEEIKYFTHEITNQHYEMRSLNLNNSKKFEEFYNEAFITLKIGSNDHIIKTKSFKVDRYRNEGFILIEKLDTNLGFLISSKGRFEEDEMKKYFYQICKGMEYLHLKKISHLNLTSKNVLVNLKTRRVKLTSFGRAKEFVDENEDKEDQWKAGMILYHMITGTNVFTVKNHPMKNNNFNINEEREQLINNISISNHCFDLLSLLFHQTPLERPSFNIILNHPFFNI